MNVPAPLFLTRAQSRNVDEIAIGHFGIPGVVLMENAGRNCAEWIIQHVALQKVLIVCGSGNNGGDGFVIARYLQNAGFECSILLTTKPDQLKGDAKIHFQPVSQMGINVELRQELTDDEIIDLIKAHGLVLDCLLGTGLDRVVKDDIASLIDLINQHSKQIIAIDVPSGLDADIGKPLGTAIKAQNTLTMVSQKTGFQQESAHQYTGKIHVIDIGIPLNLLEMTG